MLRRAFLPPNFSPTSAIMISRLLRHLAIALSAATLGLSLRAADAPSKVEPAIIAKARAYLGKESALNGVDSLRYVGTMTATDAATPDKQDRSAIEISFQKSYQQLIVVTSEKIVDTTGLDNYEAWRRTHEVANPAKWKQANLDRNQIKRLRAETWENLSFLRGDARSEVRVEDRGAAKVDGIACQKIAFVHDEASPLARQADCLIGLRAGEEHSVAATKTMIAGLAASAALVAAWGRDAALALALRELPVALASRAPPPEPLVEAIADARSAFVLGRGSTFAIAAEAALKLKETCAIHAEAFSSAEVMHGPAEIARPGFLVLAFPPRDAAAEGFGAVLDIFRALGARVVSIEAGANDGFDKLGAAETRHPLLAPIAMIHRFYGLAEAVSRRLGRDPDRPRNLRKVTETR